MLKYFDLSYNFSFRFDFYYHLFVGTKLPSRTDHICDDNCFYANDGKQLYKAASMMARDACSSYVGLYITLK